MLTRKSKKIPGITKAIALKAKKFKMVTEAVKKMQNNEEGHRKRAIILSVHPLFKHICTNTSSSSKKRKDIFSWKMQHGQILEISISAI